MHAVVRTYSGKGAIELFALLEQRKSEVEQVMGSISGFHSYVALKTRDGGLSVTVCNDKAGTDESVRIASDWIKQNAPGTITSPPDVAEGPVIIQFD